jgi:hypothetical protein
VAHAARGATRSERRIHTRGVAAANGAGAAGYQLDRHAVTSQHQGWPIDGGRDRTRRAALALYMSAWLPKAPTQLMTADAPASCLSYVLGSSASPRAHVTDDTHGSLHSGGVPAGAVGFPGPWVNSWRPLWRCAGKQRCGWTPGRATARRQGPSSTRLCGVQGRVATAPHARRPCVSPCSVLVSYGLAHGS